MCVLCVVGVDVVMGSELYVSAPTNLSNSYQKELYGLFDKYQCSPFRSFVGPLANIALFVPMFFGLRRMGSEVDVPGACGDGWEACLGHVDTMCTDIYSSIMARLTRSACQGSTRAASSGSWTWAPRTRPTSCRPP